MRRRRPGLGYLTRDARLVASVWVASVGVLAAQTPVTPVPSPPPPGETFPVALDQVTVDVVVASRNGDPVSGLTAKDFTVLEDGRPQGVVSFDVVRRESPPDGAEAASDPARWPVATNVARAARHGRTFVIVFDNLHMSPLGARSAKAAVAAFLEKGTRPADDVLLLATGENFWWNTRAGSGRADLRGVLKGLEGRRFPEAAGDRLTDYEAVQISVYRDAGVAATVMARFDRYGGSARQAMQESQQNNINQGMIDMYVDQRALEAYLQLRTRLDVTLGVLERSFKALEGSRDRKTVILVSEGFVNDPSNRRLRAVTEAARRVNAALYFVDTRGLEAMSSSYSAEFGAPVENADRLGAIADIGRDGDGAAALAADTGGFAVRNTNDFAAGIVRIGRESESYYLLGYVPAARAPDGRFHKIDVRVRGKGLVVRARKGYYDAGGDPAPGAEARPAAVADASRRERSDPALQQALDSPSFLDAVPLRMSAYAVGPAFAEKVQVVVAADADVSKVAFGADGNAVLDTLLVVAAEQGGVDRADRQVELQRRATPPAGKPAWYSFLREFMLGSGRYQAKLVVRDAATARIGTVALTFEVPPLDALRVSTPVLTDTLQKDAAGVLAPTLLARREFRRDAQLFCQFEVFGAAKGPDRRPSVKAGHELRRRGGSLVGRTEPTPVTPTSLGAVTRLIQLPLSITTPGEYELVLTVIDEISGQRVERVEPFAVIAPP
jgi:VWFA-related protein